MAKLLLSSLAVTNAYQAALAPRSSSTVSMTAIRPGDVGTTRPLGVWDPLGLMVHALQHNEHSSSRAAAAWKCVHLLRPSGR